MSDQAAEWMTLAFIAGVVFLVVIYDLAVIHAWGLDASISRVLGRLIARQPLAFVVIVFSLGAFVGHVWLP